MAKVKPKFNVRKPKLSANCGIPICNGLKKKSLTGPAGNNPPKKWAKTDPITAPIRTAKTINPIFLLATILSNTNH